LSARRALGLAAGLLLAAAWVYALTRLWRTVVPGDLHAPHLDAGMLWSAAFLRRARNFTRFEEVEGVLASLAVLVVLAVYAARGARLARESAAGPIGTGMLLGMLGLALVWLAGMPFRLVEFWWVKAHGIVHTGWLPFVVGDYAGLGARFLAACLALVVVMGCARRLRRWWPVAAVPVLAAIQLGLALAQPVLLSGLHRPRDPRLVADAARLARAERVRDVKVRVLSVHRDTTAPNAEAVGTGDGGHVILWDTLLRGGFTRRQLDVVIAHEIGHLRHRDTLKAVGFAALLLIPLALLVAALTRGRGGMGEPRAVPVALLVVALFSFLTLPLANAYSRRVEAAADWAALNATRDPAAARGLFHRFVPAALSEPTSPLWAHALFDNHPTELDRIAMADAWARRHGGR
jgi:STE24 endopeptidase